MAFPEDVFPPDECCEVCGVRLDDEVVIQEFADGSLARLCPECAAGAVFDPQQLQRSEAEPTRGAATGPSETDPLEMTKELLVPVSDLIGLQAEMQAALERLAASLERFATEVISDSIDKTASVESRLKTLESELEKTRTRLHEAESLMVTTEGATPVAPVAAAPADAETTAAAAIPPAAPSIPVVKLPVAEGPEVVATSPAPPTVPAGQPAAAVPTPSPETAEAGHGETFRLEEVQWTQRLFNESPFTERIRDVRRSLGKPKASLSRVQGADPRVLVTIIWDIVWYQYLVNLRKDAPSDQRVALFREGMDLSELAEHFKEKNASIDDDGRLDASELEVRLLSDPSMLITEMSPEEERALEDATEEVWDQQISQEFKWDA